MPLVVPEVNADDLKTTAASSRSRTARRRRCARCSGRCTRSTRSSASSSIRTSRCQAPAAAAVEELTEQTRQVMAGESAKAHVYPHQIAFNLLPQVDVFLGSGYTKEEWKIINETRKIMHEPELPISATCVRVPVYVGPLRGRARGVHEGDHAGDVHGDRPRRAGHHGAGRAVREHVPDAVVGRRPRRHLRRAHPPGRLARQQASPSGWSATTCARARR